MLDFGVIFAVRGRLVKNGDEEKYRFTRQIGLLTTIPGLLLAGPAIGYFAGSYLDKKFGTEPWLMVFLVVMGFVASIRQAIAIIAKAGHNSKIK